MSLVIGKGSIFLDDLSPTDFPIRTSVRTIGPEDQWTIDENGRMPLNGILTNMQSAQPEATPRETEVFQTLPATDDGVIYLSRILPIDIRILPRHYLAVNQNPHMILIRKFLRTRHH